MAQVSARMGGISLTLWFRQAASLRHLSSDSATVDSALSNCKIVSCQHCVQARAAHQQSQHVVQNSRVSSLFTFFEHTVLIKLVVLRSSSLPAIFSLLGLWLILFLFFSILFLEVFGLTKWGGSESPTINYSSLGSAMVMLAFQSVGFVVLFYICADVNAHFTGVLGRVGTNSCTISEWCEFWALPSDLLLFYSDLTYPRCTSSLTDETDSDCGSTAWAFFLFIAWNLLSMVCYPFGQ